MRPREIAFILSLLLLGGCFPVHRNFWEPLAEGGKSTRRDCHGHVGPQDSVEFEREGIRIIAFIDEKDATKSTLVLTLRIPPRVNLAIPSGKLIFRNPKRETNLSLTPYEVLSYDNHPDRQFKPIEDWSALVGESHRVYFIRFVLPQELDDIFFVFLPIMMVTNADISWPQITFSRTTGWYVYPLNC